jgi:hypothetical protein
MALQIVTAFQTSPLQKQDSVMYFQEAASFSNEMGCTMHGIHANKLQVTVRSTERLRTTWKQGWS